MTRDLTTWLLTDSAVIILFGVDAFLEGLHRVLALTCNTLVSNINALRINHLTVCTDRPRTFLA